MRAESMKPVTEQERLKYEAAEELGLLPRLMKVGWGGLTAGETGKIGGVVARRMKNLS